ncbi:MAG: MarR family transcriptional regulator [Reyranella sp.]|jgi:MarR family transcriptional regulator for hemolysin|nr:MAG: MarR family transcriptional regulator [Reyranella sp.]
MISSPMPAVEPDDPTQTMGMLVYDVARLMRRHFAAQMAWSGLGQSSWRLLVHVARKPGLRAADLAEIMEMRPISVSRVLDGLMRSELIERRADAQDRRAWRLFATRKARPLIARMEHLARETRELAMTGLRPEERSTLLRALAVARVNMSKASRDGHRPAGRPQSE